MRSGPATPPIGPPSAQSPCTIPVPEINSRPCFFFFQAEDGIRDDLVTGVQTCALPISRRQVGGEPCDEALQRLHATRRRTDGHQVTVGHEDSRRNWHHTAFPPSRVGRQPQDRKSVV